MMGKNKLLNITLLGALIFLVLCGCTDKKADRIIDNNAFILTKKDYEAFCFEGKIENNTLNPTKCLIEITSLEKLKFQKKILALSKEKWIRLLRSKNIKVSTSASIWLYSLSKQKVELIRLGGIELGQFQKEEVIFWRSYFNEEKTMR